MTNAKAQLPALNFPTSFSLIRFEIQLRLGNECDCPALRTRSGARRSVRDPSRRLCESRGSIDRCAGCTRDRASERLRGQGDRPQGAGGEGAIDQPLSRLTARARAASAAATLIGCEWKRKLHMN